MADETSSPASFASSGRGRAIIVVALLAVVGAAAWYFMTRNRESTDDAQVDGHVVPIAARVGGAVTRVAVTDNQEVEAGAVLVEIDPRDYQIAVDKARAELATAEAQALAAQSGVPIASTETSSNIETAQGAVTQSQAVIDAAEKEVEAAKARLSVSQARLRESQANADKAAKDVERLRGLLAKDEVSQQQFDAAVAADAAQKAAVDSARSQITEGEAGIRVAESRLAQAKAGQQQASASLRNAQTAPQQMTMTRARASAAQAQVEQAKATLARAELDLQHAIVKAPARGVVSKRTINPGQIVQPGQPLVALVLVDDIWVTANFKETQLTDMRPGQRATVKVDAYGGREFTGKVESISPATGARFSLLPPENATGNFVKVVQRVPVKIVLDKDTDKEHVLRPGMSVVPTVYTK
jgi:membrane fusion protein (multidrug efflux system)